MSSAPSCETGEFCSIAEISSGSAKGSLRLSFSSSVTAWTVFVVFDSNVWNLNVQGGNYEACFGQMICSFSDEKNGVQAKGATLIVTYSVAYLLTNPTPKILSLTLNGQALCETQTIVPGNLNSKLKQMNLFERNFNYIKL